MKYIRLNILFLSLLSFTFTSCGTMFSVGAGVGGPIASSGSEYYDDGYGFGYGSRYGRIAYDEARREALFLSDKMAYELGLTNAQYEAVYEINLDYLLNMQGENTLFGNYWARRNSDLFYVLDARQYNYFVGNDYFYRPVYWRENGYAYRVYNRYADRNVFYRPRPVDYMTYRGGRNRLADSYYAGRFGRRSGQPIVVDRVGGYQETYQNGHTWSEAKRSPSYDQQGRNSFGNASRGNFNNPPRSSSQDPVPAPRPSNGSQSSFGNMSRGSYSSPSQTYNQSFGGARQRTETFQPTPGQSSSTRTDVPVNRSSFGGHR
mgnify:FL=1